MTNEIEQDEENNARSADMKKKGSRHQRSTPSAPSRRPLVSRSKLLRRPPGEEFRMGASAFKARMTPDAVEEDSDDSDNGSDDFNHDNSISEDKEPQKPPASCQLHPWASLTVPELKSYLEQWGLRVFGHKTQLVERLEDYQQSKNMEVGIITDRHVGGSKSNSNNKTKETTKKLARWQCSKAKAILVELHLDDNSPVHNKSAEELYALHKEFQLYPFRRFAENLKSLRAAIKKEKAITASDERDFSHDQIYCPRKEKTSRGVHFWDTHPANLLLQSDLRDMNGGTGRILLPSELRMTRKEYQYFSVKTFCGHVHQEKRKMREKPYWIPKRNKDGMKRHEEEVNRAKTELSDQLYLEKDLDETKQLFGALKMM